MITIAVNGREKQFPDAGEIPRFRPPDICHMKGSFRFG